MWASLKTVLICHSEERPLQSSPSDLNDQPDKAVLAGEVGQGATSLPAVRQGISSRHSGMKNKIPHFLPAGRSFGLRLVENDID